MEGRAAFLDAGGKEFHYIPCMNDDEAWITALCELAVQHMAGWPTLTAPPAGELAAAKTAALAMGAKQ
jgi:ferrochelatase